MTAPIPPNLTALEAVAMQDQILIVAHDLDRLKRVLKDAFAQLSGAVYAAGVALGGLEADGAARSETPEVLAGHALIALQFDDIATQLIDHAALRLRHCSDRLARAAFPADPDDAPLEPPPLGHGPIASTEMSAGAIELF
jgi:hypothetical protein